MNPNRTKFSWNELKGQAKRQTHRSRDENIDFFEDDIHHHEQHKSSKEKADKHLSNLHGLLRNMPGYNANNSSSDEFNEKTSIPLLRNIAGFKTNKSD